ncbi:MAG: hypothetical protein A2Z52_00310 [Candidatus Moranbacteria bacterium RBG_19FT_COMBO_42_6]|nr:MAG: hypothetical protein A2Z52_00310 [Candidatus Moranbacteria bacterium RBG_19FT_COMBO_42_6]
MPKGVANSMESHIDQKEILRLLPHRGRAIKIDRAIFKIMESSGISAFKKIGTENHDLEGHFPDNPIYPGVAMIEGANQAAAILIKILHPDIAGFPISKKVDIDFIRKVRPDSELEIKVSLASSCVLRGSKMFRFFVTITNEKNKLVATGFIEGVAGKI